MVVGFRELGIAGQDGGGNGSGSGVVVVTVCQEVVGWLTKERMAQLLGGRISNPFSRFRL